MKTNRKRRTFIRIMQYGQVKDSAGQLVKAPTLFAEAWADIRHPTGVATLRSDAELSQVKASIRVDYIEGVIGTMWVEAVEEGLVYDIQAALPDIARKDHLDLVCTLGVRRV